MRSQGQASCLLTLEFKCHLRYCSSQEVDVSLSHSAVLHYIGSDNVLVPTGINPLPVPKPKLTQIDVAIWHH